MRIIYPKQKNYHDQTHLKNIVHIPMTIPCFSSNRQLKLSNGKALSSVSEIKTEKTFDKKDIKQSINTKIYIYR